MQRTTKPKSPPFTPPEGKSDNELLETARAILKKPTRQTTIQARIWAQATISKLTGYQAQTCIRNNIGSGTASKVTAKGPRRRLPGGSGDHGS